MEKEWAAGFLSILASVMPTIAYVLLIWWADRYEKEPFTLLAVAFIWGALPAVILAFILEALFSAPLSLVAASADLVSSNFVAPVVEETVKALALMLLYLLFRAEFDDVLDGIVYGALIGFGFGMTENIAYFLRSFVSGGWGKWAITVFVRSTLFGLTHAFYTAIVGAAFGYARLATGSRQRRWIPIAGLTVAIVFHAIHNSTLTLSPRSPLLGLIVALTSDWGGILLVVALIILAWRKEASWIASELAEEVSLNILSAEEYANLSSYRRRMTTYWQQWRIHGWQKAQLWRTLAQQATDLAFKKHQARLQHTASSAMPAVNKLRIRILALRQEMGQATDNPLICLHCGHILRPENNFCTRCGQPRSSAGRKSSGNLPDNSGGIG